MKYAWLVGVVVAAAMFAAVTVAQEAKKEKVLDEGAVLEVKGALIRAGERPAFKVEDGEFKDKTFFVLENSKLEALEKAVKEQKLTSVQVTFEATKYGEKNFLIVAAFVNPAEEGK